MARLSTFRMVSSRSLRSLEHPSDEASASMSELNHVMFRWYDIDFQLKLFCCMLILDGDLGLLSVPTASWALYTAWKCV